MVTDTYVNEAMDPGRYRTEMERLAGRRRELDHMTGEIDPRKRQQADIQAALHDLGQFCRRASEGLDEPGFEERQLPLRLVVERITVEDRLVRIETVILPSGNGGPLRARRPELVEGRSRVI